MGHHAQIRCFDSNKSFQQRMLAEQVTCRTLRFDQLKEKKKYNKISLYTPVEIKSKDHQ